MNADDGDQSDAAGSTSCPSIVCLLGNAYTALKWKC